jgi:small subunit ribosomal protein S34
MATSKFAQSLKRLLPLTKSQLPPALKPQTGNLYQILSRTPTGGVGTEVHQLRWSEKEISNSYWVITRSKLKCGGKHGKAWGQLYWKGLLGLTNLAVDTISYVLYFRCPCGSP